MNRGELRTLVLDWLDDVDAGYFTPADVNTWLNNAQYEVQKQLLDCGELWYMKCATAYTTQFYDTYSLPSDFAKMHRLEFLVQGAPSGSAGQQVWSSIEPATLNEGACINFGTGQPALVTIGKNCLILRQIPDSGYFMRMFYSYIVTPMQDDLNVPDCPIQYHQFIAVQAAWDGYMKDQRDPSIVDEKRAYYLDMMKKDQIQRNRSRPRRVVQTEGMGGGWGVGF